MQLVEENHPGTEAEGEKKDGHWGPVTSAAFLLTLSAAMPAFVHLMFVVARWSWNLIG